MTSDKNELVMYLVVNKSLGMGLGKVGAQCGHAVEQLLVKHYGLGTGDGPDDSTMNRWLTGSRVKVVLGAEADEWVELLDAVKSGAVAGTVVTDEGRTEIAPDSETVIGLWPRTRAQRHPLVAGMKLLR